MTGSLSLDWWTAACPEGEISKTWESELSEQDSGITLGFGCGAGGWEPSAGGRQATAAHWADFFDAKELVVAAARGFGGITVEVL